MTSERQEPLTLNCFVLYRTIQKQGKEVKKSRVIPEVIFEQSLKTGNAIFVRAEQNIILWNNFIYKEASFFCVCLEYAAIEFFRSLFILLCVFDSLKKAALVEHNLTHLSRDEVC